MKTVSNCRQVIIALKQYAADHKSAYPDSIHTEVSSANQVFREFFREGIITDERIFGCPSSVFYPDNEIGVAPNFEKALMPGECHWMLLKGQTDAMHPKTPILIENAENTSWPPRWKLPDWRWWQSSEGHPRMRGKAWRSREVIIGRNDGSVTLEKLRPDGTLDWHSANNLGDDGKSWIDQLTPEQIAKLEYWDVEEK